MLAPRRAAWLVALIVVFVLVPAGSADAHAILLRTDPSPQSTSKTSPSVVALDFSEPVEVAFGAIRVFDVDGARVDAASVRRAQGDRRVEVPVKTLAGGTYTVTWRVVSGDGHPVQGGFQFYVGAPSSVSPVSIGQQAGGGRALGWVYGAARFAWFSAFFGLIGLVVTRRFVWTPAVRVAKLDSTEAARAFRGWFARALPLAWLTLLVATAAIILFQAATVSGLSLAQAAHPNVLREVLVTAFGRAWLVEAMFAAVAVVPVAALARRGGLAGMRPDVWIGVGAVVVSGMALAVGASGHARTDPRPGLAIVSIAVHLVIVGVWVGGLAALVGLAGPSGRRLAPTDRTRLMAELIPRFSRVAIGAVAVVIATGVINSIGNLASVSDLWQVTYGRVLSTKIVLLVAALGLGWWHLRLPRRLERAADPAAVRNFDRTSVIEVVVLFTAVAVAAGLVVLVPGRSLALAGKGPVNVAEVAGGYTVQLFVDPSKVGRNEIHVTFVNPQGLGAAEVTNATATLTAQGSSPTSVPLRLIAPGHLVGDIDLSTDRYRLAVDGRGPPIPINTTFSFRLAHSAGDKPKER